MINNFSGVRGVMHRLTKAALHASLPLLAPMYLSEPLMTRAYASEPLMMRAYTFTRTLARIHNTC